MLELAVVILKAMLFVYLVILLPIGAICSFFDIGETRD